MRGFSLAIAIATALLAASVALAADNGRAAAKTRDFRSTVTRTAQQSSLRFGFTVHITKPSERPYTLHARGVTGGASVEQLHVNIDNGPTADTKLDGTFLYFRSTGTQSMVGPLWIRERLASIGPHAPELKLVQQVSPVAVLRALQFAVAVRAGARPGVFHAALSYANPYVRIALSGLDGNTEFRNLHLTAWSGKDAMLRKIRITGRTADGSTDFALTLRLGGYGKPVSVTPPREADLLDVALNRLAA